MVLTYLLFLLSSKVSFHPSLSDAVYPWNHLSHDIPPPWICPSLWSTLVNPIGRLKLRSIRHSSLSQEVFLNSPSLLSTLMSSSLFLYLQYYLTSIITHWSVISSCFFLVNAYVDWLVCLPGSLLVIAFCILSLPSGFNFWVLFLK